MSNTGHLRSYVERIERPVSCLTLDEQAKALSYALEVVDLCLGHTGRDTNRAYWLAARMLGLKSRKANQIFRDARVYGAEGAVARHRNFITVGEECGWVYFAFDAEGRRRLKIGFSLRPEWRIAGLQMMTGILLREIYRKRGFILHEHLFHIWARPAWLGGEWFDAEHLVKLPRFQFLIAEMEKAQC